MQETSSFYRGSSIFGFDRNGHQKDLSRDWFAPADPVIRLGDNVGGKRDSATGSVFGVGRAGLGAHGTGPQFTVPLQQQFQTPGSPRGIAKTVDGFEIISVGYRQDQGGSQYRR